MSQQDNVELMANLTGLTHDIFVGDVQDDVRRSSPASMCFQEAGPGEDYRLEGQNMVYAVDLRFKTGGIATSGNIPDYVGLDAVQGKIAPTRRYERLALDNLVELQASGPGAFEDIGDRIFNKLWDAWESMVIRHDIGYSTGLVAKADTRSSSTVFTIKDGYGRTGTNPLSHLSEGSIIGWYDVSASGVGGAAKISSINYSTDEITVDSGSTWEPSAQLASDDLIYFASTNDSTASHFELERNQAPNGIGTILDPNADLTTVFNISESTYQRHKPFRKSSVTFDHLEVTEHWLQLGSKRGFGVTPESDKVITYPSVVAQLARSLMAFQQQAYTGGTLRGGYGMDGGEGHEYTPHSGVVVSGMPIYADQFFYHDVFATLHRERMFRINLGGDADFWSGDGSMWSRISDYDGKDAYVVEYGNNFSNHRGANGALTGISTDLTDDDFASVPNY